MSQALCYTLVIHGWIHRVHFPPPWTLQGRDGGEGGAAWLGCSWTASARRLQLSTDLKNGESCQEWRGDHSGQRETLYVQISRQKQSHGALEEPKEWLEGGGKREACQPDWRIKNIWLLKGLTYLGKEFDFFFFSQGSIKSLNHFKPGSDIIWFLFFKGFYCITLYFSFSKMEKDLEE